eukprot:m.357515 g.357515  ORF g.357515 m.357515 type:complete len:292 (+) comp16615_c0_seq19:328-1203(+)
MRFHNKLLVTLAVTTGLHSAPATPSPPQSPKFTVIKHDLTQDWEFITLYNACIRCTLQKDNTFPCEVINTSLVRNLTDEWGPWPRLETVSIKRDTSWSSHSNVQIEHKERLLVPFLEHKYALHNVYHQMIGTVWPVLNSLTHFRPTSVLFRQPLTSPGQPLPNSIFKELVTLTLGAGYVTLKQPVCASELCSRQEAAFHPALPSCIRSLACTRTLCRTMNDPAPCTHNSSERSRLACGLLPRRLHEHTTVVARLRRRHPTLSSGWSGQMQAGTCQPRPSQPTSCSSVCTRL